MTVCRFVIQDLFKTARSILMSFLYTFSFMLFVNIHLVLPYSSMDIATNWKSNFILWDVINNLSIAVNTFTRHILTSHSVDETLLLRYVN